MLQLVTRELFYGVPFVSYNCSAFSSRNLVVLHSYPSNAHISTKHLFQGLCLMMLLRIALAGWYPAQSLPGKSCFGKKFSGLCICADSSNLVSFDALVRQLTRLIKSFHQLNIDIRFILQNIKYVWKMWNEAVTKIAARYYFLLLYIKRWVLNC